MTPQSVSSSLIAIFLTSAVVFAGAGANGGQGWINPADLTDPAQILAVAESLGAFSISSTPEGTYPFTNTTIQELTPGDPGSTRAVVLNAEISLTELDFSAGQTSVPEPSYAWIAGIGLAALAVYRRRTSPR